MFLSTWKEKPLASIRIWGGKEPFVLSCEPKWESFGTWWERWMFHSRVASVLARAADLKTCIWLDLLGRSLANIHQDEPHLLFPALLVRLRSLFSSPASAKPLVVLAMMYDDGWRWQKLLTGHFFSPSAFSGQAHSIRELVCYTRYLPLLNMGKQGKSKCSKRGQKLHVVELFHMEMNKK